MLKSFLKSTIGQLGSLPSASKPPAKKLTELWYLWESTWIAVGSVMMRGGVAAQEHSRTLAAGAQQEQAVGTLQSCSCALGSL